MKKIHHKIYLPVILLTIMSLFVFMRTAQAFRPDTGEEQQSALISLLYLIRMIK